MRRQEAWGTLRHLVVEGSPQQGATMLSALLLGYAEHGRDRAALLCDIAFAQLMADGAEGADAALATARRAETEAAHPRNADDPFPAAQAAATLALVLAVRGPGPGEAPGTVVAALERAADLLVRLPEDDPALAMPAYLVAESALLHGRFVVAEETAALGRRAAAGPVPADPADPIALVLNELVLSRSLILRGRRRDGALKATRAADHAARLSMSSLEAMGRAVEAVSAAASDDRAAVLEADRRARRLSPQTGRLLGDVATWSLLAYAAFLQGRHAEAAHLLTTAGGGPDLSRLPWTLRRPAYELLATAAVQAERLDEASMWLARGDAAEGGTESGRRGRGAGGAGMADLERRAHRSAPVAGATAVEPGAGGPGGPGGADDDLAGGWSALTPRERHVAELASRGLNNRRIADRLFLSERAVRMHLERVYRVLDVHGRAMLPSVLADVVEPRPLAPQKPLTERQESVAALVAEGMTNAQVADTLGMSVKTVEKHLRDVFTRWGVNSRSAVATAWRDRADTGAGPADAAGRSGRADGATA